MGRTRKANLWLVLMMTFIAVFSCFLGVFSLRNDKSTISASAETMDVTDAITFTQDDWMTGGNADAVTLSMRINNTAGGYLYEYLVADSSIRGYWNDNGSSYATTNGVDIMDYLYFNGESVRSIVTKNQTGATSYKGTDTFPLSNGGVYSPIAIETHPSWTSIAILKAWIPAGGFTLTVKEGFTLLLSDGKIITATEDVSFKYENGTITKVVVVEKTDVTDGVTFTQDDWMSGSPADCITLSMRINNTTGGYLYEYLVANSSIQGYWNDNGAKYATTNGVDIMDYLYFNGESARSIVTKNQSGATSYTGTTFPLSIGGVYSPIAIETHGSWTSIKILKAWIPTGGFTLTVKEGFTLLLSDGKIITATEDVSFKYVNGTITKIPTYTLSFSSTEGAVDPIKVTAGETIGTLPAVPAKAGYTGVWQIDGAVITESTVYGYGADKTATAVYTKNMEKVDVADSVNITLNGKSNVQSILELNLIADATLQNGYWNLYGADLTSKNHGVDIMQYIYVNGRSVRELSNENASNNAYVGANGTWVGNGYACAPVFVETSPNCVYITVVHAFSTTNYTITLKAGFELLLANGDIATLNEDVEFSYNDGVITRIEEYTLSFDGLSDVMTVTTGQPIGILPDLPEVDGELVLGWAIDGVKITEDTLWTYTEDKTATPIHAEKFTLSFDGLGDTVEVFADQPIGELPAVPEKEGCEGVWKIDGVEITADTIYTYGVDKTALAAYSKDITDMFALEDRQWGAASDEYYFGGVLDNPYDDKDPVYINTAAAVSGCWNVTWEAGYAPAYIAANNGVDIKEFIYVNGESVKVSSTKNGNGETSYIGGSGWISGGGWCAPVCVETTTGSGIMIKILKEYAGDFFEITFKAGLRLIDTEGVVIYLSEDVTYKYINNNGEVTFEKGKLTDEDLDAINGKQITLMDGAATYFEKSTCRLTLPAMDSVIVEEGLSQVFVGWTTAATFVPGTSDLYSAGYQFIPETETTLYAVWIGFEMQYGAAVRLTSGSSGIRFLTDISAADYKKFESIIRGVGTFIVPTDYLETGVEFIHENFGVGYYQDMPTEKWKVNGETDSIWTYAAAFTNLPVTQYARCTSARGYLKISFTNGEGYIYTPYTDEANARSMYQVATKAYDDYSSYQIIKDYVNKVADLTWNGNTFTRTEGAKGVWEISKATQDGAVITIKADGDFGSMLINGKRLIAGSSKNVALGNYVYKFNNFTLVEGGFTFEIGAANRFADKESEETLSFYSSDSDLDFFLNDYFKRHSGYTEDGVNLKVNSVTAGVNSEEFFSHEWMSMAYYWYNSDDGYAEDRIAGLREFLSSVPVDDYGYVWSSNDNVLPNDATYDSSYHRMGWPIPHAGTLKTAHWDFNGSGDTNSWSSNVGASITNGLYKATVNGQSSNVTFTSDTMSTSFKLKNYTKRAPLLQMDIRIADASNVEDIYVWYTTSASKSFSEDKKVSVKDKAFMSYDLGEAGCTSYNHLLFLPMYAESAWGASESTYVRQIKIEIALKSGKTISGEVALNSVRLAADTRQINNNSILISSLRQDYDFTGDVEYLTANITRARKALNFLMQMYDSSRKLLKGSYLVGHEGDKSGSLIDSSSKVAGSISQGYWDIMLMPEYDFQTNTYFYKAIADMAYLEGILEAKGITVDKSLAEIETATRSYTYGASEYSYTASSLNTTANDVVNAMRATTSNNGFWDEADGRFVAGYGADGNWYDYGYVAWNLEAIYYGVATDAQANSIMAWLSSETDLYEYEFAPRSNTVEGKDALNGQWYDAKWSFGDNVQYGGAIMYTSFYDLMARINYNGVDDAFARLTAIQEWYMKVYNYYTSVKNADPNDFYRYYYDNEGLTLQGSGTEGGLGLDAEFLESYLPLSAVAYGFFGIDSIDGKTLQIAPELPTELTYWGMENLAFNFVEYDIKAYKDGVQITSVRGDTTGLKFQIVLNWEEGNTLYVNGVQANPDKIENGKVYVTVDMGATIVEVR